VSRDLPIDCGLCGLRPWQASDVASLVREANNRNVWLGLRDQFPHPYTPAAARGWIASTLTERPPPMLAIAVGGEAVGGIGVVAGRDVNRHTGEIGYWLGESYWGRGIATAAVRGFVPYAASAFGLRRLHAKIFANNPASCRVLEKCGFVREGVLREHALKDGRYLDEIVYGLLM
jgi:ribosomal-protein-alanine N-acetyltransferase